MQSKNELGENRDKAIGGKNNSNPTTSSKTAYSCYFETQLNFEDFGKSRNKHNKICNQLLLKQLRELNKEGIELYTEVSNEELIVNICLSPQEPPHRSLVWEHCHTATVIDGKEGVMRLVPGAQHTAGTEYWKLFHPDHKNRGGYHEWAVPRGAPVDKPKNYPPAVKLGDIEQIKLRN